MFSKRIYISLVLLLVLSACSGESTDLSLPSVATVDGVPITRTLLNVYLEQQGISNPTPEQTGEALNNLIQLFAVSNAAREDDQLQSAKLSAELELQHRRLLFERYAESYIERYPTSDSELQQQYRQTVSSAGGQQYRLETVIFENEQQALDAILALQNGADYGQFSSSQRVEVLDWIDLTRIPADFAQAIKRTQPEAVAPVPLPSPQGWRLVKVLETRAFTPPPFEQISDGMRRDLNRQKVEAWTKRLRENADIELENVQVE